MSPARDPSPTRRRFCAAFAGATAALLAGCVDSGTPGSTSTPPSPTTVPDTETTTATPSDATTPSESPEETATQHYHTVDLTLDSVTANDVANAVLRGDRYLHAYEADLIERTVREGTSNFSHVVADPLHDRTFVDHDGYYEIRRTVTDERQVVGHQFDIDAITTCQGSAPEVTEDPVDFASLPGRDQQTFSLGSQRYYDSDSCFSGGRKEYYPPADERDSVFVNDSPTFVRYDDDVYRVVHERSRELTLTEFRFEATKLGSTEAEFVDTVVPEVVWHVDVDVLSQPEREFFEHLRETGSFHAEDHIPEVVYSFMDHVYANAYDVVGAQGFFLEHEDTYYRLEYEEVLS